MMNITKKIKDKIYDIRSDKLEKQIRYWNEKRRSVVDNELLDVDVKMDLYKEYSKIISDLWSEYGKLYHD